MRYVCLFFLISFVSWCRGNSILLHIPCDNSPLERSYIFRDYRSHYDMGLRCRITDADHSVVYRFELDEAVVDTIDLKLANSYKISLSRDGKAFKVFAQTDRVYYGLSNQGDVRLDVKDFLAGASCFYLKSEHMDPSKGWGGCLFGITLLGEGTVHSVRPKVIAGRVRGDSVVADGVLSEAIWERAQWMGNFNFYNTTAIPTQPTYGAFLWDDDNLYVGIKAYDAQVHTLQSMVARRDGDIFSDNCLELFLVPRPEKVYYHLAMNSNGVQFDETVSADGQVHDRTWNGAWSGKTSVQGDRWEAELVIPWQSLGCTGVPSHFRFNLTRNAGAQGEMTSFVPMANGYHQPWRFADLRFESGGAGMPSGGFNVAQMAGNPPRFEILTQPGTAFTKEAQVGIRLFSASQDQMISSEKPVLTHALDVTRDSAALTDLPLPAGNYLAVLDWKAGGTCVYRQSRAISLAAEDRAALTVENVQPYYQDERALQFFWHHRIKGLKKLSCVLDDAQGKQVYRSEVIPPKEGLITLPMVQGTGTYTLTVTPVGHENLRQSVSFQRLTTSSKPTEFGVTSSGWWTRNGRPFFPRVLCLASNFDDAVSSGFNLVIVGADANGGEKTIADNLKILDEAQKRGLYVMLHLCNLLRGHEDYEGLKALVSRLKNHPALAAWYLADEPSGTGTSAATLRRAAGLIRLIDGHHPVAGCDNSPLMFGVYRDVFDVFMPNPYPVPHNELSMVGDWIRRSKAALGTTCSIVTYLQGQGKPWYPRGPQEHELFNMMLQALASGSQGLAWWAYGPMRDSQEWPVYARITTLLKRLENRVYSQTRRVLAGDYRCGLVEFTGKHGRLMLAVNALKKPIELPFKGNLARKTVLVNGVTMEHGRMMFKPHGYAVWME